MKITTIEQYVDAISKLDEKIEENYKNLNFNTKHNALIKKRQKITGGINMNIRLAETVYFILLLSNNIETLICTASHCLRLDIFTERSLEILNSLSNNDEIGIHGFEAKTCLRLYRGEIPNRTL
ncbi:MAG: hypothetical protein LBM02_08915 [Lachnospiraceae bacterium]|nr:hypothetical protein [Lachnospiraceae bacterium]